MQEAAISYRADELSGPDGARLDSAAAAQRQLSEAIRELTELVTT